MDNTIMPSATVLLNTVSVETFATQPDLQASLDKDAFEVALQDAVQRQNMGDSDRLVSASTDTLRTMSLDNDARRHPDTAQSADSINSHLCAREPLPGVAYSPQSGTSTSAPFSLRPSAIVQRDASDYVLSLLSQRLNFPTLPSGETFSLELVGEPSGVQGIDLTLHETQGWSINVSLSNQVADAMSGDLMQSLRRSGFKIESLTIDGRIK